MSDGLWKDHRHRLPSPHQPRRRQDCLGELVQIDGSEHAWFEDRGAVCTLLAFVDDATSRLEALNAWRGGVDLLGRLRRLQGECLIAPLAATNALTTVQPV
jgi:hypothetical protein